MRLYPGIAKNVVAVVGIAGASHGTTVCRGLDTTYYGCDEIAPGTPWLARLNAAGEAPGPTAWQTIYDGLEGDPFFVGPDEASPAQQGADNRTFNGAYHNDLRVLPAEVDTYLSFLLSKGQAGPGADPAGTAHAAALDAAKPDGRTGRLCGIEKLTGPLAGCPVLPAVPTPSARPVPPVRHVAGPGTASANLATTGLPVALPLWSGLLVLAFAWRRRLLER